VETAAGGSSETVRVGKGDTVTIRVHQEPAADGSEKESVVDVTVDTDVDENSEVPPASAWWRAEPHSVRSRKDLPRQWSVRALMIALAVLFVWGVASAVWLLCQWMKTCTAPRKAKRVLRHPPRPRRGSSSVSPPTANTTDTDTAAVKDEYKWRLPPLLPVGLIGLSIFYIWYNFFKPVDIIPTRDGGVAAPQHRTCLEKAQQGPSAGAETPKRNRRIFIDLGANDGQSLEFLMKWKEREGEHFDPSEWEVYFFELNPQWEDKLKSRCRENEKITICVPIMAGAWTKTGEIGYFKDAAVSKPKTKHGIEVHYDSVGTSLYNRKEEQAAKGELKTIAFTSPRENKFILDGVSDTANRKKGSWQEDGCVVDFSAWLQRVVPVSQMDEVLLKVDIEGAEYELMEHLNRSGVMRGRLSTVAVEWHPKIFANSAKRKHSESARGLRLVALKRSQRPVRVSFRVSKVKA
ncbi:hypothetical protein FOZ63_019903, partial [Perkinsus olseni]